MSTLTTPRRTMARARGSSRFGGPLSMRRSSHRRMPDVMHRSSHHRIPSMPSVKRRRPSPLRRALRAMVIADLVKNLSKRGSRRSSAKARGPMVGALMAAGGWMLGRQMMRKREQARMDQPTPAF